MERYRNISDKIYEKSKVSAAGDIGGYAALAPGLILGHDPLIAIMVDDFKKNGFKFDPASKKKCLFTADHFAPPATVERANALKKFLDFSFDNGIKNLRVFEGICHQLMVEDPSAGPFSYIIGSDSHTCTAGALACLASGYGSMDIMHAIVKGYIYERKFPAVRVDFTGTQPGYIDGRDIFLALIAKTGEGGANKMTLEYFDRGGSIAMDDRFSVACASVETGAAAGIFAADDTLYGYIAQRGCAGRHKFSAAEISRFYSDISFEYDGKMRVDLSGLRPLVALPHDFSNIEPAGGLKEEIKLDQVFIGSCASGRLLDFKRMCEAIDRIEAASYKRGLKKAARSSEKTRLIVTPASQSVFVTAMKAGYIEKLIKFGAVITNPSCGPCGGIDKGILADGEICLTTATRNFKGRMGPPSSSVYVSSAVTAICSAYAGRITSPEEFYTGLRVKARGGLEKRVAAVIKRLRGK